MNESTMYDHTPGPWEASVNAADEMCVYSDSVSFIATVNGPHDRKKLRGLGQIMKPLKVVWTKMVDSEVDDGGVTQYEIDKLAIKLDKELYWSGCDVEFERKKTLANMIKEQKNGN